MAEQTGPLAKEGVPLSGWTKMALGSEASFSWLSERLRAQSPRESAPEAWERR